MNIFVLFGQTATGKTAKALELVEKYNGEIVNFDSRQIYKKLNIVTGKDIPPNAKFNLQIQIQNKSLGFYQLLTTNYPHHIWLYDIVDPKDTFSSADYCLQAEKVLSDIITRGKTPILVGGTGYYLRHLLFGTPDIKVQENMLLRTELNTKTVAELQSILAKKNASMLSEMNNSDRNNPHRLIRRIEIAESGKELPPLAQHETLSTRLTNLSITYLPFFHSSTDVVREKITLRVEQRVEAGALKEVEDLLNEGYTKEDPGLNAIGYQQIIGYIENKLTLSEMKKQWITKEVQYAKRQKTYFNKYFSHNTA